MSFFSTKLQMLFLFLLLGPGFLFSQRSVQVEQLWEVRGGLDRPESVVLDEANDRLYVSNIVGNASEKDGQGYISAINPDGSITATRWVDGLHAPKGMAILEGMLYVADVDALVVIDIESATITNRYPAEGAQFLNDVTADSDGTIYVTDSAKNAVYRFRNGTFDLWLRGNQIRSPNGIYAEGDQLIIAAAGPDASIPGSERYLHTIHTRTKRVRDISPTDPLGGLDGIEPAENNAYFLTDWPGARVMYFRRDQGATTILELTQGTADLEYDRRKRILYIPVMMSNRLVAYQVQ